MTAIGTTKANTMMVMSCFGVLMKPSCSAVCSTFCSGVFISNTSSCLRASGLFFIDVRAAHGCLRMITAHMGRRSKPRLYLFRQTRYNCRLLAPVVQWIELEFPKLSIQVRVLSGAPKPFKVSRFLSGRNRGMHALNGNGYKCRLLARGVQWGVFEFPKPAIEVRFLSGAPKPFDVSRLLSGRKRGMHALDGNG